MHARVRCICIWLLFYSLLALNHTDLTQSDVIKIFMKQRVRLSACGKELRRAVKWVWESALLWKSAIEWDSFKDSMKSKLEFCECVAGLLYPSVLTFDIYAHLKSTVFLIQRNGTRRLKKSWKYILMSAMKQKLWCFFLNCDICEYNETLRKNITV